MLKCEHCGKETNQGLCSECSTNIINLTRIQLQENQKLSLHKPINWTLLLRLFCIWAILISLIVIAGIPLSDKELLLTGILYISGMTIIMGLLAMLIGIRDGDLPSHHHNDPRTPFDTGLLTRNPSEKPIGSYLIANGLTSFFIALLFLFTIRISQDKYFIPTGSEIYKSLNTLFTRRSYRSAYSSISKTHYRLTTEEKKWGGRISGHYIKANNKIQMGLKVSEIAPNGKCAKRGLKDGDFIIGINGKLLSEVPDKEYSIADVCDPNLAKDFLFESPLF